MKKKIFKPKPLSKAEQVYLQTLAKRPAKTPFNELVSKVNKIAIKGEEK
ncbi:MAG: hypothetical protein WDA75_19610 [Candidatus Latescibacterota bacterium]|jgi:hypothetical protein|nr:hypothetical protein [Ignavibacteriaceae bacterium]